MASDTLLDNYVLRRFTYVLLYSTGEGWLWVPGGIGLFGFLSKQRNKSHGAGISHTKHDQATKPMVEAANNNARD